MMKYPEVITLDNSDDDDSDEHSSGSRNVGATASVICAKPLSFSTLQPRVGFWPFSNVESTVMDLNEYFEDQKKFLEDILHKY